jgi:hypothetical protein
MSAEYTVEAVRRLALEPCRVPLAAGGPGGPVCSDGATRCAPCIARLTIRACPRTFSERKRETDDDAER